MKNFNLYAQYYDLFYQDKNYVAEVNYIDTLIRSKSKNAELEILDLGCGTGKHDYYLNKLGYKVDGVDLSQEMVSQASENFGENEDLNFYQGNIIDWQHPSQKKYDIVISLFHVMSYMTHNESLLSAFKTAYNHLKPGGLFIYDCWYGQGVINDKPTLRTKKLENDFITVQRLSTPVHHFNQNVVDVHFDVLVEDKNTLITQRINEHHQMRYFFLPELTLVSSVTGFADPAYFEWMNDIEPLETTWNIVAIQMKPIS